MSARTRTQWIDGEGELAVARQCALAGVARSSFYARGQERERPADDLAVMRLIDEEYTRHPFYGSRRMVLFLACRGVTVNRKRVQRLMRVLGLAGMAPGPNTSRTHPAHRTYPYLLRGVHVQRPNQVWSTDITYLPMARGFMYLVAVIRLVFPARALLAHQQQHGHGVLRGLPARGAG